jgi:hypothetical protein
MPEISCHGGLDSFRFVRPDGTGNERNFAKTYVLVDLLGSLGRIIQFTEHHLDRGDGRGDRIKERSVKIKEHQVDRRLVHGNIIYYLL